MSLVFRDLYNALKYTEEAFDRMGVDIDNAMCGMPTCVLTKAQENLLDNYMELANIDMDFCTLDFDTAILKLQWCFDCISDELKDLLPEKLPDPEATVDNCGDSRTTVIPRNHIKRFRIYERTYTHNSIPSPVQIYTVEQLPYSFQPSVPAAYSSHEKYELSWDDKRNALKVRLDNDFDPAGMPVPRDSFNITLIMAELTDEAQQIYGYVEVSACTAFLMTQGVEWQTGRELEKSVDGDWRTYPALANQPNEVIVEYQFKA